MPAPFPQHARRIAASLACRAALVLTALAAPPLAAPPVAAGPHPATTAGAGHAAVLDALSRWVAEDRGTEVPALPPRLVFLPPDQLQAAFEAAQRPPATGAPSTASTVLAFYDQRRAAIILPRGWTGADPVERSILVHELVHHFQFVEAERFACSAARENDAYAAQERYLAAHGLTLQGAIEVDPLFLLMATNCMF
jgi:hypothetical protein